MELLCNSSERYGHNDALLNLEQDAYILKHVK